MDSILKDLRKERNMTQEELAEKSGVSRVTIADIERGIMRSTTIGTLKKLADALEVSTSVFMP